MDLITPSIGLIFWTTITFVILLLGLSKYAWKPILGLLNDREEGIKTAIEEAERAREEMAMLKADNEKILREARAQRETILKEAREMKLNIIEDAKGKAKETANRELEAARIAIANEKVAAQHEIKQELATLSIGIAEKVLKGELKNISQQETLVASLIEEINFN